MYSLKQAPCAWYNWIEAYIFKEQFEKYNCEHTLFIKTRNEGKIVVVRLCVDNIIFTSNNENMFVKFKNSMKLEFDMIDLGKMKYFLWVEVFQIFECIYIVKYAKKEV